MSNKTTNEMSLNTTLIKERPAHFVKKVCEHGVVWSLENKEGLAISSSWEYENDKGEPIGLICFWSDQELAKGCSKDEWHDFKVIEISLPDFIEIYCIGMANDGFLLGTNFDSYMFGYEIDPLELILQIFQETLDKNQIVKLNNYNTFQDLIADIEDLMHG